MNEQAERCAVGEICPNPIDENGDFISHAENRNEMYKHPCKPRQPTGNMNFLKISDGKVSTDSSH